MFKKFPWIVKFLLAPKCQVWFTKDLFRSVLHSRKKRGGPNSLFLHIRFFCTDKRHQLIKTYSYAACIARSSFIQKQKMPTMRVPIWVTYLTWRNNFLSEKKHIIRVILTMTLDNQGGTTSLVIWHILIHNLHCLFCGSHLLTLKNIHGGKIRKDHSIQTKIFSVYNKKNRKNMNIHFDWFL